jgi:drug/metabolite transporter (DMT)-like permease
VTRLRADALLLFSAVIWGAAFLFQKSAMAHIGPLAFIGARGFLAALALWPLAWREGRGHSADPGLWTIAVWGGIAFFIAAWFQQAGLATATVTNAGFLTAFYVVITPFVAWAWRREAPALVIWPAVALSMAGTWLLGGGTLGALSQGDRTVALSAFFWAIHVVVTGQASRYGRAIAFTAVQFAVVGALGVVGALLVETTTVEGLAAAALDIAYVGLLSGALTFTILSIALRYTPPEEAAVLVSMETVFAAAGAYVVFGERLPLAGWFGATMILSSILIVQLGSARAQTA